MLKWRVTTALVLGALLAWLLFTQDRAAWGVFLCLAAAMAADEWAGLALQRRAVRLAYAALTFGLAVVLLWGAQREAVWSSSLLGLAVLFWCLAVPWWLARGVRLAPGVRFLLIGWIVILPTVLALAVLRARGVPLLLASLALIWVSDICAYFVGRAFGRHRLAPSISPGKTWEGVAGALLGVLGFGVLLSVFAGSSPGLDHARAAAGLVWLPLLTALAMLGIEGDLFESWLKRCAGLKDSGWILPGHGGVLDRIDALTAALPAAALLLELSYASPM